MSEKLKTPKGPAEFEYKVTYTPPRSLSKFKFSPTEIRHLTISALLVMAVGLSIFRINPWYNNPFVLGILAAMFASIFLLHELAHKMVAQHFGLWAEFRLFLISALLTLLSVVSPIKFISPGAVMIAGSANKKVMGKTALAGPLTNVVLSVVFLTFAFLFGESLSSQFFFEAALLGAAFNAWIALFNLIPIAMLDGLKVFHWNKLFWGLAFGLSVALTALTFNYVYM